MVPLSSIQKGIVKYIDYEILPKLTGWQKWAFGAVSAIWIGNIVATFNKLKQNALVSSLGVIDEQDMIDIDKLHREFRAQAEKGSITVEIPGVGPMTLDRNDVDKLYQYIMEG